MHAITHIIATTDFSAVADRAVQRAALIAKQLNAELHLMHVVYPLDLYTSTELSFGYQKHLGHMLQELSKNHLNTLAAKLQEDLIYQRKSPRALVPLTRKSPATLQTKLIA